MKKEEGYTPEEDRLLDPIAQSILHDLQDETEEDQLLDHVAESIVRDLEDEVEHVSQEHAMEGLFSVVPLDLPAPITVIKEGDVITVILDTGQVIRCDEDDLEPNEVIHCNMAMEQNQNDEGGLQGGQGYVAPTQGPSKSPTKSPTLAPTDAPVATRFDKNGEPNSNGLYDPDGNVLRFDQDGNPDPDGMYDANGDVLRYNQDGKPNPNGLYDASGDVLRFDENGNPDPNGTHDADGYAFPTTVPPSVSFVPTIAPTARPTVAAEEAEEPSYHPTLMGAPWTLRGTVYYDHNANGRRDSMVQTLDFGDDAEFTYGLGGVTIKLVECDPETNRAIVAEVGKEAEGGKVKRDSYASTVTQGVDVLMHPKLVGSEENGGVYNLIDIRINRAYFIQAAAPKGFIFTGGICNDDVRGWRCRYGPDASPVGRRLGEPGKASRGRGLSTAAVAAPRVVADPREFDLGVRSGRSDKCVTVDRRGVPDDRLDLGAMRLGDISFGDTEVQMSMDLLDPGLSRRLGGSGGFLGRFLQDGIDYVLLQKDKEAIGVVTAEVLAAKLDVALSKKGAVLQSVEPLDIIFIAPEPEEVEDVLNTTEALNDKAATDPEVEGTSEALAAKGDNNTAAVVDTSEALSSEGNNSTAAAFAGATVPDWGQIVAEPEQRPERPDVQRPPRSSPGRGGKLTVNVRVNGHYNKNNKHSVKDFDGIVQDSINRDTEVIREGLVTYNDNCKDQTTKVLHMGYTVNDYKEVHSDRGVDLPESRKDELKQMREGKVPDPLAAGDKAFSSACDKKLVLPEYFETSLAGLEVKAKTPTRVIVVEEESAGPWVIILVVVAGVALTLCLGCYMFRHRFTKSSDESDYYTETISSVFDDGVDGVNSRDLSGSTDSSHEKVRKYEEDTVRAKEMSSVASPVKPKKKGFLTRVVYRELGNMSAALTGNRWRFGDDQVRKSEFFLELEDPMKACDGDHEARLHLHRTHQREASNASLWPSDDEHRGSGKDDTEEADRMAKTGSRRLSSRTSSRRLTMDSRGGGAYPLDEMIAKKVSERNLSYSSGGSRGDFEGSRRSLVSRGVSYGSEASPGPGAYRVSNEDSFSASNNGSVRSARSLSASFVSGDGSHRSFSSRRAAATAVPIFIGQETIEEEGSGDDDDSSSSSSDDSDGSDSSTDSSSSSSDDDEARKGRKAGSPREENKARARKKRGKRSKGKTKQDEASSANRRLEEATWTPPSLVMAPPKSGGSQGSRRSAGSQGSRRSAATQKSHRSAASQRSRRSATSQRSHKSTTSQKSRASATSHLPRRYI